MSVIEARSGATSRRHCPVTATNLGSAAIAAFTRDSKIHIIVSSLISPERVFPESPECHLNLFSFASGIVDLTHQKPAKPTPMTSILIVFATVLSVHAQDSLKDWTTRQRLVSIEK